MMNFHFSKMYYYSIFLVILLYLGGTVYSKKAPKSLNNIEDVLPAKVRQRIPPHIQIIPFGRPITPEDVKLYLYTRKNKEKHSPELIRSNGLQDVITSKYFDKDKPVFIIIHGSFSNYSTHVNDYIRPNLLKMADVNAFYVDYHEPAHDVTIIPGTIFTVGKIVGNFVNRLSEHYKISPDKITLVGYSLGSHVSGVAGTTASGKIGTIIGLDPAGLAVSFLNKACAKFVEVIHTSDVLGYQDAIGHVDFYPNGGKKQPGCNGDILCDHVRAVMYYAESLANGGFTAVKCNNYKNFETGRCDKNKVSFIGRMNLDKKATGKYFLNTASEEPFSVR